MPALGAAAGALAPGGLVVGGLRGHFRSVRGPVSAQRPSVDPVSESAGPAGGAPRPRSGPRPGSSATSLSPSRAGDFQQCPLLYRFRTVDRLPEPPSAAAVRGTLVHAVLEGVFDLPAEQRTPEAATAMLPGRWAALLAQRPEVAGLFGPGAGGGEASSDGGAGADGLDEAAWLARAAALVERWFTLEEPARLEPAEREVYVETTLDGGLVLRGYVDRLDVSPDGLVRVVDYKTGRSPGAGFENKALFQMRFYALVLWRLRGVVPTMLQLVYLGDGQVVRYSPDAAELEATERKVLALWAAISAARASGDWRPRKSRLCGWCSFQALCPEWGGTPPPLPEGSTVLPVASV